MKELSIFMQITGVVFMMYDIHNLRAQADVNQSVHILGEVVYDVAILFVGSLHYIYHKIKRG